MSLKGYLINKKTMKEKQSFLLKCLNFVHSNKVIGAYYEFGVYKGDTFKFVYDSSKGIKAPILQYHAFDTFQGLPYEEGLFNIGDYKGTIKEFTSRIKGFKNVHIHKGLFKDTIKDGLMVASIINIDCDVYESAREVLSRIKPLLQIGTIIIFDDYNCFCARDDMGERLAFKEFQKHNKSLVFEELYQCGWNGKAYVLKGVKNG